MEKKSIRSEYMDSNRVDEKPISNRTSYNALEDLELERKRIARELHDSTIQTLTMLIYRAELCNKIIDKDVIRTKLEIELMIKSLKESIDDIRNTIYDLHPMSIDDLGLAVTIERYLKKLSQTSEVEFKFSMEGKDNISNKIENLTVYRLIQECCCNIIKHSNGAQATIYLSYTDASIKLKIEDNGKGISEEVLRKIENDCFIEKTDIDKADEIHGFGIPMMKERVSLLRGTLKIHGEKTGTTVMAEIPLFRNEEDIDG